MAAAPPSSTASSVSSRPICSGHHKTRLLIGEGNFSFALALIRKHDERHGHDPAHSLGHSIIATELKTRISCEECVQQQVLRSFAKDFEDLSMAESVTKETPAGENRISQREDSEISTSPLGTVEQQCSKCQGTAERIRQLHEERGVTVKFQVDGTKIDTIFPGQRFERIHWNVPHDGKQPSGRTLTPILKAFFKSCSKVQKEGDRVHIVVPWPQGFKKQYYAAYVYDLVDAATCSRYRVFRRRKFSPSRYQGYQHVRENKNETAKITDEGLTEFVFQKLNRKQFSDLVNKSRDPKDKAVRIYDLAQNLIDSSIKSCTIKVDTFHVNTPELKQTKCYYDCSSDDDSSDYEKFEPKKK